MSIRKHTEHDLHISKYYYMVYFQVLHSKHRQSYTEYNTPTLTLKKGGISCFVMQYITHIHIYAS